MRVSVVIPAFNEEENVAPLHRSLSETLSRGAFVDHEIVFVDDASTDSTAARVLALGDPRVRLVRLPRRNGQSIAQQEGFRSSRFEVIATIDGDLQQDPADLNPMAGLLRQGWDFVQGRRPRHAGHRILNVARWAILDDRFTDMSCGFRLFRRQCVDSVRLFNGAHRFLPYIVQKRGFRVTEIGVRHRPRAAGRTKYRPIRLAAKVLADLLRVRFTV